MSRRRKVASIRSFCAFLEDRGLTPRNPALKLVPPAREKPQPRVLTEGEYKRLLEAVRGEIRDSAIVELFLQTGMRLAELARLTLQHIDLPAKVSKEAGAVGSVQILGKGRKTRTVTLNWKACRALKAYLQIRPHVDDPHLFITKFGAGISSRAIEYLVAKYLPRRASRPPQCTRSVTPSRPIRSRRAPNSTSCGKLWGTPISRRPRSTSSWPAR